MFHKLRQRYQAFSQRRLESRIASHSGLIRKLNVHKMERKAAIDFFCELKDRPEDAVANLLKRFDFSDDNSIVDTKEKEKALAGIIALGTPAVPLLMDHLSHTERIGWPLKALIALTDKPAIAQKLLALLDLSDIEFDHIKVEKNYDLLCHLADFEFPGDADDVAKVAKLLGAKDERVRLAATELMTERIIPAAHDEGRPPLYLGYVEPFVYDTSPENTRLTITVLEAYEKHRWPLKDKDRYTRHTLDGYHITADGLIMRAS